MRIRQSARLEGQVYLVRGVHGGVDVGVFAAGSFLLVTSQNAGNCLVEGISAYLRHLYVNHF
eukprot:1351982-Amorphochlora_amoeboformis.AAC.1